MEEAVNADCVAFLRGGRILQEGKPADLLKRFSCNSLESLFLQLCYEEENIGPWSEETSALIENSESDFDEITKSPSEQCGDIMPKILKQKMENASLSDISKKMKRDKVSFFNKTKALIFKNLMVLRRHRLFMFFNILLPVLNFSIFFQAIGRPVHGVTVSYSVEDSNKSLLSSNNGSNANITCSPLVHFVSSSKVKS